MDWLTLVIAVVGLVSLIGGYLTYNRYFGAGYDKAKLEAAEREARRGVARASIDSDVRAASPDDLERLLNNKP